jgi:hypothetical protein
MRLSEAGKDNAETRRTLRYAEEEKHGGEDKLGFLTMEERKTARTADHPGAGQACGAGSGYCVRATTFAVSSAVKSATMPSAVSFTAFSVVFFSISNFATGA